MSNTTLKEYGDIRFAFSEDQGRRFNSWFQSAQTDYASRYGDDIIASIRRLGLTTFRIAMILSSLRMMDSGTLVHSLVCLDEDFSSAMAIARTVLVHTTRVLRELPRTAASLPSGQNFFSSTPHAIRNTSSSAGMPPTATAASATPAVASSPVPWTATAGSAASRKTTFIRKTAAAHS